MGNELERSPSGQERKNKVQNCKRPAATCQIWPEEIPLKKAKISTGLWVMRITKGINQIQVKGSRVRFQHQPSVFYFPSFSILI